MERFAGRYLLLRSLGQGGMGTVDLALDLTTGRECALKRLKPESRASAPDALRREFELLARVRHPAVVGVLDLGFAPDGTTYYTMEYVPGVRADLGLARGDWRALCFAAAEVAHALEALHGAGVLHGDLKPSNLLITPRAEGDGLPAAVHILDFGLAALLDRAREGHRGTPGFAAPEVVRGESPEIASDLFSLGATLYVIATRGTSAPRSVPSSRSRARASAAPSGRALEEAGVPGPLAELVLRLMAPSPGDRPRDAREVRAELERIEPSARRSLVQRLRTEIVAGREGELAQLERWLARAPDGPRVTLVAGGPGAGKTALLGELAVRAALSGHRVIRLSCAAFGAPRALATALWRQLAAEAGAGQEGGGATARANSLLDGQAGAWDEPGVTALANAAAEWSRALRKRGAPVVVLLDDLERLDAPSRGVIRRTVFHPGAASLRWAWAGRAGEAAGDETELVLLEAGQAQRLELRALDPDAFARMVAARLHATPPRELLEALGERSGGLPGLAVELLRSAVEGGALRESDEGLVVDSHALASIALPEGFEASRLARLADVSPDARRAAIGLAVRGRPTQARDLRGMGTESATSALAELCAAGLATRSADGHVALSPFTLGPAILAGLDAGERRGAHLEALAGEDLEPAERFVHLEAVGDAAGALAAARDALAAGAGAALAISAAALAEVRAPDKAGTWLVRGADMLMERGQYGAAIPHLERALEFEHAGPERARCWRKLSAALLRAGRPGDVERVVAKALAEDPPEAERAHLLCNESSRCHALGRSAEALERAHEALACALRAADDEAIGFASLNLGAMLLTARDVAGAERHARLAEEAFVRAGHLTGRVRALGNRAAACETRHDSTSAERLYREALSLAREMGLRLAHQEVAFNLGVTLLGAGRWSEASDAFTDSLRVALEDGRPHGVVIATANLATLDGLTGRAARALRRARAVRRLALAWLPRYEPFALRALAQAHRIAGRSRRARRAAAAALAAASRLGFGPELDWCSVEYALACEQVGAWQEAAEVAGHALERSGDGDPVAMTICAVIAGRAALRRRDFVAVDAHLERAASTLAARPSRLAAAHVAQLEAELALLQGNAREGLAHAHRSLTGFESLPAPADRARAALGFARLAISADASLEAPVAEWLQEAAGAFERLGDHPSRERALALTVEWLHRTRLPAARSAQDRGLLQSVSRLLDSLSDQQVLTRRAMEMAVEHLDAERGVLLLADERSGELSPVVEHGAVDAATRDQAVGYSRRVVERVAQSGGSLLISDAPTHPDVLSESVVGLGLRSILCVPLYGGGKVVGAVYVDDSRRADAFGSDDRGLLEGFAHLMATAIENSRGHEEVRRANEQLVGENLSLRREARVRFQPQNIVGTSSAMQGVLAVAERAAQTTSTALITGENGTGKELIARILHHGGARHAGPFVVVNCGAIPGTLLESELFGILDNVASGVRGRPGRFVQANGGTLFLDEIGEMPLEQQVALLSAIATREVTPVGGGPPTVVDVRIVAASNRDLRRCVDEGTFREDLFYRLNVIPIEVPPLRERKADIPAMARSFTARIAGQMGREVPVLSPEFLGALMQSDWPGNVRELLNYIERIMALSTDGVLRPQPLPGDIAKRAGRRTGTKGRRLVDIVDELERRLVREALERSAGNQSQAARELGLTEQSLRYRLRKSAPAPVRRNRRTRK